MTILINSSKTMVVPTPAPLNPRLPRYLTEATQLAGLLQKQSPTQLKSLMHISADLAAKTQQLYANWSPTPAALALDSFAGDIYRGLQAQQFSPAERAYADDHLLILSGLYGGLRPLDGITPYRLELLYRLHGPGFKNLYDFWQDGAAQLVVEGPIVNLASVEYARLVTPFVDKSRVVSPRFLSAKRGGADFVAVHAKVARGAFAAWMIRHRVRDLGQLKEFEALDYVYNQAMSTPQEPTYVRPFN